MRRLEIAVAGAGPAGLAAALFLARAGHRVIVFERFETPKPLGSGLVLQPTGLSVLHALGLLDDILALGNRLDRLHGRDAHTGRTVLDARYSMKPAGRFGLAIHRAALFNVLFDAVFAEDIPIETGMDIAGLDMHGERPCLLTSRGQRLGPFDLVVDASGARSPLRHHADIPVEPRPLAYGAIWTTLDWVGGFDERALSQRYDGASVMIGVLPVGRQTISGGDQAAFFWSLKVDTFETLRKEGLSAWKERVLGFWPESRPYVDQINGFDEVTLARYQHHTLPVPAGRGLAIIGDAAHSASPQLGQGANMALLDAAALGAAIASADDVPAALQAYASGRRTHVRLFQALSRMFTPFYQSDSDVLPFLRDWLVATVARIPPAPSILAALVSGMLADPLGSLGVDEPDWARYVSARDLHMSRRVSLRVTG
ncbi:FAD dependent oxidoreductase [Nitratireductor indicus C115]|uniref:FAD dependent oxidoreductase n=1 Tax=Nitratireductor indicus C115 TaxID=1231190 RepID=K2PQK9_9HYPH|nr:NAD(P)/FAD-dependent oxidoreductase [Nitratireductor indicus]EKF43342.1 FAD dependent oxidoreductase [Nitratireductor indicus C115]SFQ09603.1 2-polyprenyl-6-methoxyphenol hydroxylase [Nitratireductor indicus]